MSRVFILFLIWFSSTLLLYIVYSQAPSIDGEDGIRFPKDLEDLQRIAKTMVVFREQKYSYTLLLFSLAFLYKQTFAIPGSFFMNLLGGALFGTTVGLPLICTLTAVGASFCYLLSFYFAHSLVDRCFRSRLQTVRQKVAEEQERLFFFLLSARVFPFTPHWLLNITSPFVGISLPLHFSTVAIGLIPYNFLCIRAGCILSEISSIGDVFDTFTLLELFLTACVLLLLSKLAKRRQKV